MSSKLCFTFLFAGLLVQSVIFAQVPSSARSKKVVATQTPLLQNEFSKKELTFGSNLFIRIFKEEKELEVWIKKGNAFQLFKTYPICTFSGEPGSKKMVGDNQAPEGFYAVYPKQMNPSSTFHLSFNIGYPNAYDRAHGYTGSHIMVHGNCVSIGCFAMTDAVIEEIYTIAHKALSNGQKFFRVHIFPFRMNAANMEKNKSNDWFSVWQNLQTGYNYFEEKKNPPAVTVKNKKYVFQ